MGLAVDRRLGHLRRPQLQVDDSYRDFDNSFGRDSDGTPLPQLYTWDTSKHEQFTQEFQFRAASRANDGIAWTTGLFYYDAFDSNQGYNNGLLYTSSFSDHKDEQDLENYAVFAHFDWAITEKLSMSGGLRYTDDEKTATILSQNGQYGADWRSGGTADSC